MAIFFVSFLFAINLLLRGKVFKRMETYALTMARFRGKVIEGRRVTIPEAVSESEDIKVGDIVDIKVEKVMGE